MTQTIQAEIVDALEQLLEAVKKMQEENEQQSQAQQQAQQGPPPLLPASAVLPPAQVARAITRTVTTASDGATGSLRAQIAAANPGDVIEFASGLAGQQLSITTGEIVIVEWPERAGERLPADAMRIRLDYITGDDSRRLLTID